MVHLRLTLEQFEALQTQARKDDRSIASFIRILLMKSGVIPAQTKELVKSQKSWHV
jgi:hypothetical protein